MPTLGPPQPPSSSSARTASLVTGVVKLAGLVLAINEALIEEVRDPYVLAVAAFMMAGAQGIDELIKAWRKS